MVDAVALCRHLRNVHDLSDALDDFARYEWAGGDDEDIPERNRDTDPSRSALEQAKARLDVVGMLVERRIWQEEMENDRVQSINCYSDGSPVVGAELQGMVADIMHHGGTRRRMVMPGSSLHHGHFDAINQAVAFLFAICLVAGQTLASVSYFCQTVISFTTDFGVEMGIALVPNILAAFYAWLGGRVLESCRLDVDHSMRLFPRCLRIAGWNHTCASICHAICKAVPEWPDYLGYLQNLCKFWRNDTWRMYMVKVVGNQVANAATLLQHFTASLVKWRFASVIDVFCALLPLRKICTLYVREEVFADVQDRAFLQNVVTACRCAAFWRFMEVASQLVFSEIEHHRRRGLICDCKRCNDLRQSGVKHVSCVWNSRRLKGAWEHTEKMVASLKGKARKLKVDSCEHSEGLRKLMAGWLRKTADLFIKRFRYLGLVPWAFAGADAQAGARTCVDQVLSRPMEDHDPVTRGVWERVGPDIQAVANGQPCSTKLKAEVDAICNSPLD